MDNTKKIGNLTELQCITYLYSLGYSVSIPFGNADKYDLILDVNHKLYKIQVKHCSEVLDADGQPDYITFKCTWMSHNTVSYSKELYTANDVDFFATFYQGKCYLIPQKECSTQKRLRILPPKNHQTKGISFLQDYLADNILKLFV